MFVAPIDGGGSLFHCAWSHSLTARIDFNMISAAVEGFFSKSSWFLAIHRNQQTHGKILELKPYGGNPIQDPDEEIADLKLRRSEESICCTQGP